MVKFYASANFHVDTKIDLMFIISVELASITNRMKKCYTLSWSQEKHKQHQKLCKDITEIANENKIRENTHPKFQKKKSFPL